MSVYVNTQPTVSVVSRWSCGYRYNAGAYEWYMVAPPSIGEGVATFPVSLPFDAVIKRCWLTMGLNSPFSGAAIRRVNGVTIPTTGEVDVEGITAETESFPAVFQFRANGAVFEDVELHETQLVITDPTLHIEYTSVSEPGGEGSSTIVSRPADGAQHPRRLNADFSEIDRFEPENLDLKLNVHPLSTAVMELPIGAPTVRVREYFELFSPHGSAGIFRVTEVEDAYGHEGGQTVYLEHAFGLLADSLAAGTQSMRATVSVVLSTLFETQNIRHWVLGDCEVPDDVELAYEYSYDNLLQTVTDVTAMLPEEYAWEFDTTVHPFVAHLRRMPAEDACEGRLSRNLTSAEVNIDASDLCTRVTPFGAGEGTDRVTLAHLTGSMHLDSDSAESWGLIARQINAPNVYDAIMLKDVAQRYLDRHGQPTVSVTMNAMDLSKATGEPFDRFRLGRICRLALPDYGLVMRERVVAMRWKDVYNEPESVTVTLANKLRDASDEINELMREAMGSKLIGGTVHTETQSGRAGDISPLSPYSTTINIASYGNLLSVRVDYTCVTSAGEQRPCTINVDGKEIRTEAFSVDVTRSLAADENGIPVVGDHTIMLTPRTINTVTSAINCTITITDIQKR